MPLERSQVAERDGFSDDHVTDPYQWLNDRGTNGGLRVTGRRSARYDGPMSDRQLRESANPSNEQDVEPMFPEPLVELDLDTEE